VSAEQTSNDDSIAEKNSEESVNLSVPIIEDKTKKEKALHAKKIVKVCNY